MPIGRRAPCGALTARGLVVASCGDVADDESQDASTTAVTVSSALGASDEQDPAAKFYSGILVFNAGDRADFDARLIETARVPGGLT